VIEIVSAITTAVGITKQIRDIADNVATAELKLAIASLTEQLADIKMQALDLAERNRQLEAEVSRLKAPPEVVYRDNVYFKADGDGPFCPSCYDNDQKLIRIPEVSEVFRMTMKYRCNVCKAHIKGNGEE